MNISQQFAPPFKLIAPFFIIGAFILLISTTLLFGFDLTTLHPLGNSTLSWVHLFLLGFVMMIIFGAMAQLVPVVLEVGHFAVDLYYIIYPLLFIGTIMMSIGFYSVPILLPFGGIVAFIAFAIFLFETFLTILKVEKINFVITTVAVANLFLLLGLIIGIVMALGYSGMIDIDISKLLKAHIYFVFIGYVGITIMGMSLVLLPMFWLSHSFSWIYVKSALAILSIGVLLIAVSSLTDSYVIEYIGYTLSIAASFLYFYQIYIIYKTRVRIEKDIYFYSMVISYISLIFSLILGIIYIINPVSTLLLNIGWLSFYGFIAFIIIGHLYKIIPFLVWYERFSPYVGKKKVPMLADMIPVKSANMQLIFNTAGLIVVSIGIFSNIDPIFKSGISFLVVGMTFLVKDIMFMINFKE